MNRTIFCALMWKEYRLQRSFWISLALLGAMLLFLIWEFNANPTDRAKGLLYTALCLPVFYALGCASTMFAAEHDAGTYQFQRSLPVTASRFFWSKIAFAFLSTLAMIVPLCLLAFIMGCGQMPGTNKLNICILTGEVIWLYIVWGVFFSLILKRPLLAAIVSVLVASMGPFLIPERSQSTYLYFIDTTFPMILFCPIAIFAGLTVLPAIVNIWLGRRWFRENPYPIPRVKSLPKLKVSAKPETLTEYMSHGNSWSMLGRLTWQHWRQSSWVLLVIAAMLAPLLFFACVKLWLKHDPRNEWASAFIAVGALSALALPPLAGSFTFLADQRQKNFHFLADRGINPRLIWLSRLWPWTIVIVCAFAALALFFIAMYLYLWRAYALQPTLHEAFFAIVNLYGYIVLSICVGQFCSMFFRSGVLAAVFSLVITGILCWWAAFMWTLGISWLWSVAPIPLVLLLATWLRAPDWLAERSGWRGCAGPD